MKVIPKWWKKELEILDSTYFTLYNDEYDYFEIKREVHYYKDGVEYRPTPTLAVFKVLNARAMTNLRKRKFIGRKYAHNPYLHLKWIDEQRRIAKEKSQQLANEQAAEGFMKIHKLETSKTFT